MRIRNIDSRHTGRKRRAGFTLIEMMVVVAIIVALAGVGIFYMAGQADRANIAKAQADMKSIEDAATAYKLDHPEIGWPQSLDLLMQKDDHGGPYLAKVPLSPWGQPYNFDPNGGNNGGFKPDISAQVRGGGMVANWSTRVIH